MSGRCGKVEHLWEGECCVCGKVKSRGSKVGHGKVSGRRGKVERVWQSLWWVWQNWKVCGKVGSMWQSEWHVCGKLEGMWQSEWQDVWQAGRHVAK